MSAKSLLTTVGFPMDRRSNRKRKIALPFALSKRWARWSVVAFQVAAVFLLVDFARLLGCFFVELPRYVVLRVVELCWWKHAQVVFCCFGM